MALTLNEIQDFKGKYPKQLWYLFFSEMWERFCFYGMRGMLTIFMVDRLFMDDKTANLKYGAIQAFVYAFTFVGGLFADKILGFRKSLFWGGTMMILGNFIIALFATEFAFYLGICFTIIGTGFFKPNISTMVGKLYKEGDSRRDAGFGLFYSGINAGALLGGVLMVYVGKFHSWSIAFALAGIVMIVSLVIFVFTQRSLGPIGLSPMLEKVPDQRRKMYEWLTYAGTIAAIPLIMILLRNTRYTDMFMYIIGPVTLLYLFYEIFRSNPEERKKLWAGLIFIIFSVFFWAFFEQSGGSLSLFALNNLHDSLLGLTIDPNVVNNSSNSVFVILFSPLIGLLWVWMSRRKIEPNSGMKFGLGFLFLAAAFLVFYATVFFADASGKTSLDIFTLAYLIITIGELCLSPIGLSLMTKLAPDRMQGLMMGMWFLASAYGQYVAGLFGAEMSIGKDASAMDKLISYTNGYKDLGIYALIAGIVLIALSPLLRRLMGNVR
ncbi:MAG: peptide MFS transporter [Bacteroidia bacterium]|nr:peptide MFS transporter [Bacteroidia bacterium]MCC6768577.1 peptide MFS transporter [Bacteroidia bacterium]